MSRLSISIVFFLLVALSVDYRVKSFSYSNIATKSSGHSRNSNRVAFLQREVSPVSALLNKGNGDEKVTITEEQQSLFPFGKSTSKFLVAAISFFISTQDISFAAPPGSLANPVQLISMEKAIQGLEVAETRGDAVQAMADLYEVVQSKTLLARSKFKYVSDSTVHIFIDYFCRCKLISICICIFISKRIVEAINDKHAKLNSVWDDVLNYESRELKRKVDPLRTVDLKEYLKIAPYIGGVGYLVALFVQQKLPELFGFAYPAAVFVFAAPIIFIITTL